MEREWRHERTWNIRRYNSDSSSSQSRTIIHLSWRCPVLVFFPGKALDALREIYTRPPEPRETKKIMRRQCSPQMARFWWKCESLWPRSRQDRAGWGAERAWWLSLQYWWKFYLGMLDDQHWCSTCNTTTAVRGDSDDARNGIEKKEMEGEKTLLLLISGEHAAGQWYYLREIEWVITIRGWRPGMISNIVTISSDVVGL